MHPHPGRSRVLRFRNGRYAALATVLVTVLFLLAAGCTGVIPSLRPQIVYPSIEPVEGAPSHPVSFTYAFEDGTVTLTVPINGSVFYGAQRAEKNASIPRGTPDAEWVPGYYLAFLSDPAQDGFYEDLISQFRRIRDERGLDSDRYLELMAVGVQSLPYREKGGAPHFAVETFAERTGDCDDKSLLLAGLLSREGYRVSLLVFDAEDHMAVGITADGCRYRNTSFSFLESTNRSLVGIPPERIEGKIPTLSSEPLVIPVGSGNIAYGACGETLAIQSALVTARDAADSLEQQLAAKKAELDRAGGNPAEYHRLVSGYNSMVDEHNRNAVVTNYIVQHLHDRPGTFRWLRSRGLVPA
jgi:hypothetical protein